MSPLADTSPNVSGGSKLVFALVCHPPRTTGLVPFIFSPIHFNARHDIVPGEIVEELGSSTPREVAIHAFASGRFDQPHSAKEKLSTARTTKTLPIEARARKAGQPGNA
jgi:hypothetical protein